MAPSDLSHDACIQNGGGSIEFRATQISFEVVLQILQCIWSVKRWKYKFETTPPTVSNTFNGSRKKLDCLAQPLLIVGKCYREADSDNFEYLH